MKYINTRTGAVIETPAEISGGGWKKSEPERTEDKRQKEKPGRTPAKRSRK